ncbi:MAG: nuclear transport factor 2 family protein [Solirubrobacterales bacterium]
MSKENVEIVRRLYAAFDDTDAENALRYVDPSVVVDASHRVDGRVGHGLEEGAAILAEWMDTWSGWSHEIEDIRDLGDRVLVIETQRGRGKKSEIDWEGRFAMLFDLEGGKVTHWTIYDDVAEGLEVAGLPVE